jgi:uncharacterized membrane protein
MKRSWLSLGLLFALIFLLATPFSALAQEATPQPDAPPLELFTRYPSQVIAIGQTVTLNMTLRSDTSQVVGLEMAQLPDGWTATFRGGGNIVQSVYVESGVQATVDLRLEPSQQVEPGTYNFVVSAQGQDTQVDMPVELTIKEKLPPQLSLDVDLPTLRGTPSTTFRYNATLRNEGDEPISVNLLANAPAGFTVNFTLSGQDVTNVPLEANDTKSLSIEAQPLSDTPAGSYPIEVRAQGGDAEASLSLVAEVTGQPDLTVTAPEGRLSGQANAGRETALKVLVQNTGTAPARGVQMSSSEPNGWSVSFDPQQIDELPAGQQVEVSANVTPPDNAVAGDYVVTVNARPTDGSQQSADFRITVLTTTLWGVVGVGLIAAAIIVVAFAVMRFGRR